MKIPVFNIFGSQSSKDWDIMCFVDHIGTIEESHQRIKMLNEQISNILLENGFESKKLNCNLAILNSINLIEKVFKGTYDECNNSIYKTYNLHKQLHPLQISGEWNRLENVNDFKWLKMKRALRAILTFWSRGNLRTEIKFGLRGNFKDRLEVAKKLNIKDSPQLKKESEIDIYKIVAFQLGQTNALFEGFELYTKEEIALKYPQLEPYLLRQKRNLDDLDQFYQSFLQLCQSEANKMTNLNEVL